ncbi:venom protein 54.1-like [Centruroides vittatus]|uniref:venom protein 54.1-like n=1 Tax=Centruroides vittatus TaxID=120091 RepID=UPI00350F90A2
MNSLIIFVFFTIVCYGYCFNETLKDKLCAYEPEKRKEVLECYIKYTDPGLINYSRSFLMCLLHNTEDSFLKLNEIACDRTFTTEQKRWCFEEASVFIVNYTEDVHKMDELAIKKCFV